MHKHCINKFDSSNPNPFVGSCALCKKKIPSSEKEIVKKLRHWVKKGRSFARCEMGDRYYDGNGVKQSYEKARALYELAVEQNEASAMFNLGHMFKCGQAPQSDKRAHELYERAAQLGHRSAQFNMGVAYDEGQGVKQSYARAKELYELAMQQGHAKVSFHTPSYNDEWN